MSPSNTSITHQNNVIIAFRCDRKNKQNTPTTMTSFLITVNYIFNCSLLCTADGWASSQRVIYIYRAYRWQTEIQGLYYLSLNSRLLSHNENRPCIEFYSFRKQRECFLGSFLHSQRQRNVGGKQEIHIRVIVQS